MKKILSIICFVFILFLCSCDLLYSNCEHDFLYEEIKATCTSKGYTIVTCSKCKYHKKKDYINALGHEYSFIEKVEATCEHEGYSKYECIRCKDIQLKDKVSIKEHEFKEWEIVKEASEYESGLEVQKCINCDYKNERIIAPILNSNLEAFIFEYDDNKIYEFNSFDELKLVFDSAIINLSKGFKCKINYEINDFNKLLDDLINGSTIPFSYNVNFIYSGSEYTFEITYYLPSASTSNILFNQYSSLNYYKVESARASDFDDFNINRSKYSLSVSSSDQLYFCLVNRIKPICEIDSQADIIYKEMKKILRDIINDDMNDTEKLLAIHDYLVMNVTYDQELLDLLYVNSSISNYYGFYLEGVFLEKKAVCEGISKAFACLANIEGISTVCVSGYQASNPNGVGHAWNKSYVNGKWYIIDVTSDGIIMNPQYEVLSHKMFMIDEKSMEKKYIAYDFKELVCDSIINYSDLGLTYTFNGEKYDFVIESQKELNNLVEYFYSTKDTSLTIEFFVNFDYGDNLIDEMSKALNNVNVSMYSLTNLQEDLFMLIK